jgi:ankyrin repeat protein
VAAKQTTFVTKLLKQMTDPRDLEIESIYKFTALHVAAETGVVRMAKEIVEKNEELLVKNDNRGLKPLLIAAHLGHRNMVSYLLPKTRVERLTTDR